MAPQVPKDKAAAVASAATSTNLNRALASSGISVGTVSTAKISGSATEAEASSGGLGTAGLAGICAGALVVILAIAAAAYWWHRSRKAHREQSPQAVRIPTRSGCQCKFSDCLLVDLDRSHACCFAS